MTHDLSTPLSTPIPMAATATTGSEDTALNNAKVSEHLIRLCSEAPLNLEDIIDCLASGANPNFMPAFDPFKPYHAAPLYALLSTHPELVKNKPVIDALVQYGVNLNLKNGFGNSILTYILLTHTQELDSFFYLHSLGASLDVPNSAGLDTIQEAIEHMRFKQVADILDRIAMPVEKIEKYLVYLGQFLDENETAKAIAEESSFISSEDMGIPQLYAKIYSLRIVKEQAYLDTHLVSVECDKTDSGKSTTRKI